MPGFCTFLKVGLMTRCEFLITHRFTKLIMLSALCLLGNVRISARVICVAPPDPQHAQ
jgi:hypothetical protein